MASWWVRNFEHMAKARNRGFLIIELAILLFVLGIFVSSFYQMTLILQRQENLAASKKNYEIITSALQDFLKKNSHLPFPAEDSSGNESIKIYNESAKKYALSGFLPFKTLGIPIEKSLNIKNQIYRYVVLTEATVSAEIIKNSTKFSDDPFKPNTIAFEEIDCTNCIVKNHIKINKKIVNDMSNACVIIFDQKNEGNIEIRDNAVFVNRNNKLILPITQTELMKFH